MIRDYANFGNVAVMRVFDHQRWLWPDVTDKAYLDYLYTLPTTKSFWNNAKYGFDYPSDHKFWIDIWMFDNLAQKGEAKHIWVDSSASNPTLCYLLPFDDMTVKGDVHGNHVGTHPKGAWIVPKALLQTFVDATQGIGKLPSGIIIKGFKGFTSLNIRKQAGLGTLVLGTLHQGDSVIVLLDAPIARNNYTWQHIQRGSISGWVAWNLVVT